MIALIPKSRRKNRLSENYTPLLSLFSVDCKREVSGKLQLGSLKKRLLYILLAIFLVVAFTLIQKYSYEYLYEFILGHLLVFSLLIHIAVFLLLIHKRRYLVHISALDAVNLELIQEQIDHENILNTVPIGVAITSCDSFGHILWCNQQMSERVKIAKSALIGRPISTVYHTYTPETQMQILKQTETGVSVRDIEMSYMDAAGSIRHAVANMYATEYKGRPALLTMFKDVTAVRHAEKIVKQSEQESTDQMIVNKIANDFNNLLTVMKLQMCVGIQKLGKEHPAEQYFVQATGAIKESAELVNQLRTHIASGETGMIAHNFNNLLTVIKLQVRVGLGKLDAEHPAGRYFQRAVGSVKEAAELVNQLHHNEPFHNRKWG